MKKSSIKFHEYKLLRLILLIRVIGLNKRCKTVKPRRNTRQGIGIGKL